MTITELLNPTPESSTPKNPNLTPENLINRLQNGFVSVEDLLAELQCTPEQLDDLFDDPQTTLLLKLKTKIAAAQTRLHAARQLPQAVDVLQSLAHAEKPEVARRAASALIHLAGIPTTPAATPRAAAAPKPVPTPAEERMAKYPHIARRLAKMDRIFYTAIGYISKHHINLGDIPDPLRTDFGNHLISFFETHKLPRCKSLDEAFEAPPQPS